MIGTLLLNRYEILKKIGEGGMGVVYKARCTILNRFVAIKVLKTDLNYSDDFIARFKREANSIASLSHPNIVNIHDVGYEDNINFLVMEYVDGKSLTEIINENYRLCPEKTIDIALQITKALEIAHRNNIIHRDIKPDNIIITEDNIVKLMDFGIAKVTDSVGLTSTNIVMGSVHYLSPEQAKGDSVDYRADLYSLGIVIYQMLIGQVPFRGENSVDTVLMHVNEPVIPPKDIIKDLPKTINSVVLKALEKDPCNRIQTARELTEALNEIKENFKGTHNSVEDTISMNLQSSIAKSEVKYDETIIIDQEDIPETIILEQSDETTKGAENKWIKKNKKILSAVGLVILSIFALGIFLPKENTSDINTTNPNTTESITTEKNVEKETEAPVKIEKKKVPSLVGKKQDVAKKSILDNGFFTGTITSEYNDNVPNGYVINQSPSANTFYEKNEKINLIISKGKKKSNSKKNEKPKDKDDDNEDDDDKSKN